MAIGTFLGKGVNLHPIIGSYEVVNTPHGVIESGFFILQPNTSPLHSELIPLYKHIPGNKTEVDIREENYGIPRELSTCVASAPFEVWSGDPKTFTTPFFARKGSFIRFGSIDDATLGTLVSEAKSYMPKEEP